MTEDSMEDKPQELNGHGQSNADQKPEDIKLKPKPHFIFFKMLFLIVVFFIIGNFLFEPCGDIAYNPGFPGSIIFLAWLVVPIVVTVNLLKRKHLSRFGCFATNLILLAIVLQIVIIPQLLSSRRSDWGNRCILTLRALGATQLAYKDNNIRHDYASWEVLTTTKLTDPQDDYYIQKEYTRDNIINNYTIIIFKAKPSTLNSGGESNNDSTFTIVAIPRSNRNNLRTFAINDYQSPLAWIGEGIKWEKGKESLRDRNLWQQLR